MSEKVELRGSLIDAVKSREGRDAKEQVVAVALLRSMVEQKEQPFVRMVVDIPKGDHNFNLIASYRSDVDPVGIMQKEALDKFHGALVKVALP